MSVKDVPDWPSYLGPNCPIPTDVRFEVLEKVTNDDGTVLFLSGDIECHRFPLAAANPVFRRSLFYGSSPPVQGETVVVQVINIRIFREMFGTSKINLLFLF